MDPGGRCDKKLLVPFLNRGPFLDKLVVRDIVVDEDLSWTSLCCSALCVRLVCIELQNISLDKMKSTLIVLTGGASELFNIQIWLFRVCTECRPDVAAAIELTRLFHLQRCFTRLLDASRREKLKIIRLRETVDGGSRETESRVEVLF